MGKAPAFQFYPNDWARDLEEHPLEIEGAWIRICCKLWWSEPKGQLTRTLQQWAKILRQPISEADRLIKYISEQKIGDISSTNGNAKSNAEMSQVTEYDNQSNAEITVVCRRMYRDYKDREFNKLRQRRFKEKKRSNAEVTQEVTAGNGKVTPPSSSSSSSSSSKTKRISKSHSDGKDYRVKVFLDFYYRQFEDRFCQPPIIEWGKHGAIIKKLLKEIKLEELQRLLVAMFESEDKFIANSGYTIEVFKSQIQKLRIGKVEKMSAGDLWLKASEEKDRLEEEYGKERQTPLQIGYGQDGVDPTRSKP